jgi:hypothetical protein
VQQRCRSALVDENHRRRANPLRDTVTCAINAAFALATGRMAISEV